MARPNRISSSVPLSAERETELARQLLELESEAELDHFLPLLLPALKLAGPLLSKVAGPLLKNVAGSLFSGGGSKRSRPRDDQEQFLGSIVKGLFEMEGESQEQFLGGILKGILGGEMEAEHEQFLGSIVGKLFGGRELEAENYVQEQFLGSIVGKLFGGELEAETPQHYLGIARRFVRLAAAASQRAGAEIAAYLRSGRPPTELEARKIFLRAIVNAARQITPRIAAAAFPEGAPAPVQSEAGTVLEQMIAAAPPIAYVDPVSNGSAAPSGHASWVRNGNRLIFTM